MAATRPPEPPKPVDPPLDKNEMEAWAKEVSNWSSRFTDWAFRSFRATQNVQGQASILLVSPNKSVYTVQVGDDGTLSTTLVKS